MPCTAWPPRINNGDGRNAFLPHLVLSVPVSVRPVRCGAAFMVSRSGRMSFSSHSPSNRHWGAGTKCRMGSAEPNRLCMPVTGRIPTSRSTCRRGNRNGWSRNCFFPAFRPHIGIVRPFSMRFPRPPEPLSA